MTGTILHVAARDGLTFAEAMRHAPDGIALLTTPWRYEVATAAEARRAAPEGVFEARVFDERTELRWLGGPDDPGRTVVLTEDPAALPAAFPDAGRLEAVGTETGGYLLWGRVVEASDGWTTLTTERIGTLRIPGEFGRGDRVALTTREYIAREPDHGNAYIAEERLLSFEVSAPHREKA
ncbi:type III-D CRISPR-associated protein Csx19 [Actinomadura rupiterrae]|uniref:type III-D CRISPR-associated protein Csx19 n=1 Tax=Actinomadura rupiterrae TaxID=559627 RepID=UPI0020A57131|nr:CRISPR-associated protein Csx19 [Actinomadura rupiterrae]MCP2337971.1 CRISPR-associated protein (TIGR03984 family) [Actinomadura rupiterrae]